MQKYQDSILQAGQGSPLPGASVQVNTYPAGVAATIYSDNGVTPVTNPLTTDSAGRFAFYAADGHYSLVVSKTGFSTVTISDVLLEDPATSASDSISFVQAGSNPVTRILQDKVREVFNSADRTGIGANNVCVGTGMIPAITSGHENTAMGNNALVSVTTGFNNVAIGDSALKFLTTQQNNVAVGTSALKNNGTGVASGNNNTAVGLSALSSNILGDNNVAVGFGALGTVNNDENVAVGVNALANLSGVGKRNTAVGSYALQAAGSYLQSVAVGYNALTVNTGSNNTAVGAVALVLNTSGTGNVAVGTGAGQTNSTANNVTAVGLNAAATSNAADITAIGTNALVNATGASNTALGSSAGSSLTTGSNCTIIGTGAQASAVGAANEITLGNATQTIIRSAAGIRAGTETGNFQAVATLYMGTGIPNNANGQNGDFYNRADGTVAGNNIHYHKEAGAWVAYT